ncbi:heavy metal translocating P-type ATPase, partial [Aequoribacter sp.]|uniref:heavy metal translocating P-type ATPase n=1 Tax=Aequoribacter sp. TaxID=2847771 RepID=UPI003F6A1F75
MSETSQSTHTLAITGAGCASCVAKIEGALNTLDSVDVASMNFAERRVSVTGSASVETIIKAIEGIGYGATESKAESLAAEMEEQRLAEQNQFKAHVQRTAVALALGLPLMFYGWLGGSMMIVSNQDQWIWGVVGLVVLTAMVYSGSHFYLGGYRALLRANPNMDTLIALGTGAAWLYSALVVVAPSLFPEMARHIYFEASVMIVGLVSLGQAMEVRARGRSSDAIRRLVGLQAKTARVVRGGNELDVAIEHIKVGDILRVRTGEKFAVDGVLTEGAVTVDESMLTGEPMPVSKLNGEQVSAGTLNIQGSCLYRADRVGKDTALAHIITAVKQAQMAKPPIGRLADRISLYFVPVVVVVALC